MNYHDKNSMTLTEAVDTLTAIADTSSLEGESSYPVNYKEFIEKSPEGENVTIDLVKNIFKTILHHLKKLYVDKSAYLIDPKQNEGVKAIMILVGDAATKLDRFTNLFHHTKLKSVHELKEFKLLQEFYISSVAKKVDDRLLGKWILGIEGRGLSKKVLESHVQADQISNTKHVFIDLDGVKKDSEYELFFIRKEDGSRFFSPKLIRSIKLVFDFGPYFKNGKLDDHFTDIYLAVDRNAHYLAKNMVDGLAKSINDFYHEVKNYKQSELALDLHKTIIALMLAANPKNQLRNHPSKSCLEYFNDFQLFLRQSLQTREYQRMIAYPTQSISAQNSLLKDMAHELANSLYVSRGQVQEKNPFIENILHEAAKEQSKEHTDEAIRSKQLFSQLGSDYCGMTKLIKSHPNGHLRKILEMVESGNYRYYDPLFQHNLPRELYQLYTGNFKMTNIRVPAPVYQENIQKVVIIDEFKAFLRSLSSDQATSTVLLFNYQDRTSWREHARSKTLEDLQNTQEFSKNLTVVTLPKDTEFYHQESPYHEMGHADVFMQNLKEQLTDENAGFYFPEKIGDLESFNASAIKMIHQIFFQSKNVLTKDQRLDFIEIFYFFLELKILDMVKPDFFSMTCKDAIDVGSASNICLFAFLKILNQEKLSERDMEFINLLIYEIPITVRERLMLRERFDRMLSAIKVFESAKSLLKPEMFSKLVKEAFALLYETPILDAKSFLR